MSLIKEPRLIRLKFQAEAAELDDETGIGNLRAVLAETNSLSELYAFLVQWDSNGCEVFGQVHDGRDWRSMTLFEYHLLDLLYDQSCRDKKGEAK